MKELAASCQMHYFTTNLKDNSHCFFSGAPCYSSLKKKCVRARLSDNAAVNEKHNNKEANARIHKFPFLYRLDPGVKDAHVKSSVSAL